jgi:hypothetical protein
MAAIDIDTETGLIKYPMRYVDGLDEVRVLAWIELITIRGEWLTDTTSGLDIDAIVSGATDEEIAEDVRERMARIPGVDGLAADPVITRADYESGEPPLLSISVSVHALGEVVEVTVGATT